MEAIPSKRIVGHRSLTAWIKSHRYLLLSILLLIVWSAACVRPTDVTPPTEGGTEEPATQEPPTEVAATEPAPEAEQCTAEGDAYICTGIDDHQVTLRGSFGNYTPYMLDISPERKQELLDRGKESTETGCVFAIVGDLVFYDQEKNLDPDPVFDSPITISYTFTDQDQAAFEQCKSTLMDRGLIKSDSDSIAKAPVYFDNEFWKPFKKYDVADQTVTIEFTSWGDRPIGGGTQP